MPARRRGRSTATALSYQAMERPAPSLPQALSLPVSRLRLVPAAVAVEAWATGLLQGAHTVGCQGRSHLAYNPP